MAREQTGQTVSPDGEDQLRVEVQAAMQAYGDGEIDATEAAQRVWPAYQYGLALRERSRAEGELSDVGAEPHSYLQVPLARHSGVITTAQYADLVDALQALRNQA